jgi:hypothetical protein
MMILHRTREYRLTIAVIAAIGLTALGMCLGGNASRPAQAASTPSDQRLRELMTERYEILKDMVKSLEIFFNSGRIDLSEWRDAHVALYKAKADLAADLTEQIKIYEEMVEFVRSCEQKARQRADAGRMTEANVLQARLATIEAQIALEKLRMSRSQ